MTLEIVVDVATQRAIMVWNKKMPLVTNSVPNARMLEANIFGSQLNCPNLVTGLLNWRF